jgi:hypothetical protein
MIRVAIIITACIAISANVARAQEQMMVPLADVARQAEAAKVTAKKAKKTYTNANLSADPRGDTPTAAAAAAAAAVLAPPTDKPEAAADAASPDAKPEGEPEPKESEEAWRARAGALRTQVDRLRARMTDLTTPNRLRDENPGVKAANDVEIANTRTALAEMRKQWARIEASAVLRKVPVEWIQPPPVFPE